MTTPTSIRRLEAAGLGRPIGRTAMTPVEVRALSRSLGARVYTARQAAIAAAELGPPAEDARAYRHGVKDRLKSARVRFADVDPRMWVAIHEAGHAVVGHRVGIQISRVTIEPGVTADGAEYVGACLCRFREYASTESQIMLTLGGPLAEGVFLRCPPVFDGGDLDRLRELAGVQWRSSATYQRCELQARAMVVRDWDAIHRIASHLIASGSLWGHRVRELLAP